MLFHEGDKLILTGIECRVGHIDSEGNALLVPINDGDEYNNIKTLAGCVFAHVTKRGVDKFGNKVISVINKECGAV